MARFRVTKYNPSKRDAIGRYLCNEWTSFTDIGKVFSGRVLTSDEYFATESKYVFTVVHMLCDAGISRMQVQDLETRETPGVGYPSLPQECVALLGSLKEGDWLTIKDVGTAVRLVLRESSWFRLQGDLGSYVHFGYDSYMYVGFEVDIESITIPDGIFVEICESPYMELQ